MNPIYRFFRTAIKGEVLRGDIIAIPRIDKATLRSYDNEVSHKTGI